MLTLNRDSSALLLIDFQSRLMPAIADGAAIVANARRLLKAAQMFGVPVLITEENASGPSVGRSEERRVGKEC